jgi:hypothetical protein
MRKPTTFHTRSPVRIACRAALRLAILDLHASRILFYIE